MKGIVITACCVFLAAIPAPGQNKGAGGAAMTDQQFVDFAAQTDMVEANLGQVASNTASDPSIKDFAQTLVSDHTSDFKQLSTVAQQANLTVPSAIDAEHNEMMIDPFQKLKGTAFEHKYVQDMVAGHTKALAVYKKEAADAQNPALKSYAEQTVPVLEKHLSGAKDLEKATKKGK